MLCYKRNADILPNVSWAVHLNIAQDSHLEKNIFKLTDYTYF